MPEASPWRPKILETLNGYSGSTFLRDLIAGITVGLVALPLAIAFGIASGVTPEAGIYTAVFGGFLVSALGGSRIQIGGPTGAFVLVVLGIIARHGLPGLFMVTMMSGVLLALVAVTGLGKAVRFIPRPIVIGFTNGIALLIATTQVKEFLGISINQNPSEFFERMFSLARNLDRANGYAVALAVASLGVIVLIPRVVPKLPGAIAALLAGTAAVAIFRLPVETIGSRFGDLPRGFPPIVIPEFQPDLLVPLLPSALTVAILAAIESLLSAVVADSLSGDRHNPNAELLAQGLANIVTPLVGGIPVTGAIARTATNYRAGAVTPVAGIIHALTLLAVVLLFAPLASFIPLATLAAVLLVVAYNMGEWREIPGVLRLDWPEKGVWAITFVLTVIADLTIAVEVGMVLAALLYIGRIAETTTVSTVTADYIAKGLSHSLQHKAIPSYVSIVRIHGPFLFGATTQLDQETGDLSSFAPILILRLRNMTAIDSTGLHAFEQLSDRLKASRRTLILCGARRQPARFLMQAEFRKHIGKENIVPDLDSALQRASEVHAGEELAFRGSDEKN